MASFILFFVVKQKEISLTATPNAELNNRYETSVPVVDTLSIFENVGHLDNKRLYYNLFRKIPCCKFIIGVDGTKIRLWAEKELQSKTVESFYNQIYDRQDKKMWYYNLTVVLHNEILIEILSSEVTVLSSSRNDKCAQDLIDQLKKFLKRRKKERRLHLIINTQRGLDTMPLALKKPINDFSIHYNEDLLPFHLNLLQNLKREDKSGLFLLHGKPGTGKSTYIGHLVHATNRKVIFMSPKIASNLDIPQFTLFLIQNQKCILVIEDAEELIVSRETNRNSSISMLLNLTDGLLDDALGIKVLATFNTHVSNLDTALLRKGRLKGLYEFKELAVERSAVLLSRLGYNKMPITKPTSLADIFNINSQQAKYGVERARIGFAVGAP